MGLALVFLAAFASALAAAFAALASSFASARAAERSRDPNSLIERFASLAACSRRC